MDAIDQPRASRDFTFSPDHIQTFADLSGDHNPVHLDAEYAASTSFGKPIVHGALAVSVISALLASELPGPGTIYLSQETKFLRPMYVGQPYRAEVQLVSTVADKYRLTLQTRILDAVTGKLCVDGRAEVMSRTFFEQ